MSEADQVAAVLAALTVTDARPHTLGDLKNLSVPPARYTEVGVTPIYVGTYDAAGLPVVDGWRITTRQVALTEDDARVMRDRTVAGLKGVRIVSDGTPVLFESADQIAGDDGWFSGLMTWTYSS